MTFLQDPVKVTADCSSSIQPRGSGAKIKRSVVKNPGSFLYPVEQMQCIKEVHMNSHPGPVDSSSLVSKFHMQEASFEKRKGSDDSHPIQSVFLGSDRRYNRYWLFLGPCNVDDPGHRRVYFESSEDGHWDVIDTEEVNFLGFLIIFVFKLFSGILYMGTWNNKELNSHFYRSSVTVIWLVLLVLINCNIWSTCVQALCALLSVLDDRGKREALLIESLERRQTSLCRYMSRIKVNNVGMRCMSHSDQSELDRVTEDSCSPVSDVDNLNLAESSRESLPSPGAVVIEAGKKAEEQLQKWIRVQKYDSWIWNSFYLDLNVVKYGRRSYLDSLARCGSCHDLYWRDERHCKICHMTFELDFDLEEKYAVHIAMCREKEDNNTFPNHKVLSSHIQSLKAAIYAIEVCCYSSASSFLIQSC
jgi:hypothetical protein